MITYRRLTKNDNNLFKKLIIDEGAAYREFLGMGWSANEISNQFDKKTNFSCGLLYNNTLVSFVLGDLFDIEKFSEYEILLMYVCKNFRKKGLATKLINKIEEENNYLRKINLEVSKNNSKAILFYTKMKFKKIYLRKNYFLVDNEKIDALVMSKIYKK